MTAAAKVRGSVQSEVLKTEKSEQLRRRKSVGLFLIDEVRKHEYNNDMV